MALGKELGEVSFKVISTTYDESGAAERGGFRVQLNMRGPGTDGTVEGTLTLTGEPGAKSGTGGFRGANFLDDGNIMGVTGEGTWETVGKHKWRIREINYLSDGSTVASDGELDFATQSYKVKAYEWS
jgi:hypothetical protein